MEILVECETCNNSFPVGKDNLVSEKHHLNGEEVYLKSYDCTKCGKRHFVQIDNFETVELLSRCTRCVSRIAKMSIQKNKPNSYSKNNQKVLKNARIDLENARMKLMKRHTGCKVHDSKRNTDIILRFSV